MKTNTFHLHSSVVLLTNPRITNREGWRWDTRQRQQPRRGAAVTVTDQARATERRTNELGPFCHQAKNVDLRAPAPAPPRHRRDARSASALHSCSSVQFSRSVGGLLVIVELLHGGRGGRHGPACGVGLELQVARLVKLEGEDLRAQQRQSALSRHSGVRKAWLVSVMSASCK